MTKYKRLRPLLGFGSMPDTAFLLRLKAVHQGMSGNPAFPNPPIALIIFEAGIVRFNTAMVTAIGGGKIAIAEREKQRQAMTKMMVQLGHYVEFACNDDIATLTSSGFVAAYQMVAPAPPPVPPSIRKLDQGVTGELLVSIKANRRALIELRYAITGIDGAFGAWTSLALSDSTKVAVSGLTPATIYAFQVRALRKPGYTDWSESVSRMCI